MKLLADLEVTTKAVERTSEAIGEDIAAREQIEIQRAVQLDLPVIVGEPIPVLYVQVDGTGVPVVKKRRPCPRCRNSITHSRLKIRLGLPMGRFFPDLL